MEVTFHFISGEDRIGSKVKYQWNTILVKEQLSNLSFKKGST